MILIVKRLRRVDYEPTFQAMQDFTASRTAETPDELWVVEHPPVYTLGQAGKPEHILRDIGIPLVKIDRGGQVTYHGPGQVVIYLLLDLPRLKIKVRELVTTIEQAVIDLLAEYSVTAERRDGAPGVYVGDAKIAALGGGAVDAEGKAPLPAAIESALRELGCGHISPEVTPYIHGNMNL